MAALQAQDSNNYRCTCSIKCYRVVLCNYDVSICIADNFGDWKTLSECVYNWMCDFQNVCWIQSNKMSISAISSVFVVNTLILFHD